MKLTVGAACAAALLVFAPAVAQQAPPQPAAAAPPIAAPRDVPYPGVIRVAVDATDLDRRIFRVRQTIPVANPGRITLLYPQWLPGNHAPRGQIDKLAGLTFRANGQALAWTRDPVNVYAFHVDVPAGATELEAEFQFLSPTASDQGRVVVTPDMMNIQWQAVVLYPAGYYARRIMVQPSVRLPEGWGYGTALRPASTAGGAVVFEPVDLETFVDSPLFAGEHYRQIDLDPGRGVPVLLNVVADEASNIAPTEAQIANHRALVDQADLLFGSRPFDRYDFLLALTDRMGGIGLEHHRSSENAVDPDYFTSPGEHPGDRDLLPHEYVHSWNGKYRRPADLWVPAYDVPMRNSLLWVYEGQTTYWGSVLAGRSGLWSRQEALDDFARIAAAIDNRIGRTWRPLQDTVYDPIVLARRPQAWHDWRRPEDYYIEGSLIWLDVDTLIRERSGGRRSLDDFARRFFGGSNGQVSVSTYTFEDVVAALNAVERYDWTSFLRTRLESRGPGGPLEGLERAGWRLVYRDTPTDLQRTMERGARNADLTYSIGGVVAGDGRLTQVRWEGPLYRAGLAVGTQIVAVNGVEYSADRLKDAIRGARSGGEPIELLVKTGDRYRTVRIDYREGLRYPRLERIAGTPDRLSAILTPRRR